MNWNLNRQILKRLLKNKLALIGGIFILLNLNVAVFAPVIATHEPNEMSLTAALLRPGEHEHILGTDDFGRDLFSRIVHGARVSLLVGVVSIVLGGTFGTMLGLFAGFTGGFTDGLIMRVMDALYAFPYVLLAIALMTVLGPGLLNIIVAVSVINIPGFARIVRGETLVVREQEYIEAARAAGAGALRIIFSHVLPNCIAPLTVYGSMSMAGAILSEASLSFLGLGIRPPDPSWGSILKDGQEYLTLMPHIAAFPGIAILITVLGFNLFGDGLRDALDPRMKD